MREIRDIQLRLEFYRSNSKLSKKTERRVLRDEKVESKDKLVSIFETHTDILVKGKRETIFGTCLRAGTHRQIRYC